MLTTTDHPPTAPRRRRAALRLGIAAIALAVLAGSCTPGPTGGTSALPLHVSLGDDGLDLSWSGSVPAGTTFSVQVLGLGPTRPTGWESSDVGAATGTTVTDVVDGDSYLLKVQGVTASGATVAWSDNVMATFVRATLPVIRIDTEQRTPILSTDEYVTGTVAVDPNGSGDTATTGAASVRVRGNSTAQPDKKPYKIKLDTKASLLGMPTEKDWVLLANWYDRSNLRNHTAFELGRRTGLPWTPRDRFVEVVVNGDYRGVYLLTEQVELSAQRVGITEMDDDDVAGDALTGGYLLEIDQRLEQNQEPGFRTPAGVPFVVKDPEPATDEQMAYIRGVVLDAEQRLFSPTFTDPTSGYRAVVDTASLVDWYLVEEVMRNQEAWFSSTFLTKDRLGRLSFGPLWDFDLSSGSPTAVAQSPQGFTARVTGQWAGRLFEDPSFMTEVRARWAQLEPSFRSVAASLTATGESIAPAAASDRARWGTSAAPASDTPTFLRSWLEQRIDWLDAQYG